jgi:[acyl-carrier-protein] S-malonyltransferase
MGVTRAVEVGPGKVLSGLIKRIDTSIACAAAGDPEGVTAVKELLA